MEQTSTLLAREPALPSELTAPPMPTTVQETGVSLESVFDLLLKMLYVQGAQTGEALAEALGLSGMIVDDVLLGLQQRRIVEVRGASGHGRLGYTFDLTGGGRERARDALSASQYVGPVPVPMSQYRDWASRQSIRNVHVDRQRIERGFANVVLEHEMFDMLGPAINSAKSLFLYGDSGNGKTLIGDTIAGLLGGAIYVPYAVDVDGQVMVLHDPVYHRPVKDDAPSGAGSIWRTEAAEYDRRFARVQRPVVVAGGELTLDQLDLQYDPFTKIYQAPFQMKANGGVLIIDDFGRQRVPPRDLLNRWIVPLEKRIDYLALHTGAKFPVPFDCLLIISTNLDPKDLVDEAFLRRIHYKICVNSPSREQYTTIFRRVCESQGVRFTREGVDHIYRIYYEQRGIAPRCCHPRDIVDHVCDMARYQGVEAELSTDLLDHACGSYFLDVTQLLKH